MLTRNFIKLFALLLIFNFTDASPYYGLLSFNYQPSVNMAPNNLDTAIMQIPGTGPFAPPAVPAVTFYEGYSFEASHTDTFAIGGGRKMNALFMQNIVKDNAIEAYVSYGKTTFNGTRTEYQFSPESDELEPFSATKLHLDLSRLNLVVDYVINFNKIAKVLTPFIKLGGGLSYYAYSSRENPLLNQTNVAGLVESETFSKTGVDFLVNLDLGMTYQITSKIGLSLGVKLDHYLKNETVKPAWSTSNDYPDVTPSVLAPGNDSASFKARQTNVSYFLQGVYNF
jgi:hypothetical protein